MDQESNTPLIRDSSPDPRSTQWGGSFESENIAARDSEPIDGIHAQTVADEVSRLLDSQNANYLVDSPRFSSGSKGADAPALRTKELVIQKVLQELEKMDMGNPSGPNLTIKQRPSTLERSNELNQLNKLNSMGNLGGLIRDLTRRSLEEVNTGGSAPIIVSYENTYNYYFGGEREAGGKDGANGKTFRKSTNFEEGSDDHGSGFDRMQSGGSENKKHKINEFFESKHKDPKNQKQFDHNTYNGGNPQNQRNFGQHQQHSGSNQPNSRDTHQQQQRFGRPEAPPDENMDPFIDPAVYSHYYHQGRANGYHPNQQPYLPYGFPKQNQIDYSTMLMGFIIILVMVLFGLLALVIKLISRKSGSSRSRSRRKKYRRRQSKETEYSGSESSHSPEHKTPRRRKHRHQELDPTFHPKFKPPSSPMISRNTPTQINYHDQQYLEWLFLKNLMMQPLARNAKTLQNSKSVEYADDEETPEEVVEYQKSIMPSEFVNNSTSIHLKNNKLGTEQVELEGYTFRKDSRVADDSSKHSVFAKFSKSNYDAQSRKSRVASRKLRRRDFAPSDLVLSAKKSFKKKRLRGNELENINTVKSQNYIELRKRRLHALQKGQGIHRSEYFPKDRSQSHSHSESDSYNLLDKLKSRKSFLEDKEEQYTGYSRGEANILSTLSGRDPVSKGVEKEVSSDILTQPVEYENHSKDFFNDIKGGRGISEQDFLIVKKNRQDPCERNVRKTSEVIKSSTKLGAKGHKRTKSFRDLVKREHPNFFPLLADNVKKEKVLKFEQPSKFDQSNEIPVETQGEKTTTTHRPATKSRDIQIGNNRYFTNQEDSDQNLLFDGKELETEMMKLNITRPMFKFEQIAENSKEQTPVKGGTPKPPPVSLKTSEQKPTIPEDAPEPGFPKPGLQGDWMYTKYHSSLLEKFKKPKEPKSKVPKLKTQIDIYDENLKLKNFMYENGKFQNSFEKLKTIGRGSFGKVFLAKHLLENQQYAIKQINLTLTPKGELLTNSFQKEIRAMAVLQHKNVVRFFTSWMEEESEQKKLNSKVTSLFKVKGLKEDSVKLSFRKGSFENQPHADFNNSLLSDNQNYDWLQKRFGRINEEINSVDEKSVSGLSGAQFSRFGKTRGKLESERQVETAQARSIQAQKVESGQVHGVLKDETKDKISESENESLSNSSNSSSKSGTSHTSSSGESTRIYLDLHETDDDDLLITFDAPANKESFSKSFSKSGTNPHKKDEHSPEHQDTFPKKNAETIESQDELQIEFLENSVSDVANASHILNNTRSTFNFVKSRRGLSTAEEKSPQLCKSINLFIQMEFCSNGSLSRFLKRNTELTSGEICLIFTEILFGLSYIHEKGFIHRDLKPGNIFIAKNGSIKIGDFGLITYIKKDKINEEEERSPSTSPVKKVTPRVIRVIHEDEPKKGKESKQSLHQKDPKSKRRFTNDLLSNNPISPIPRRKRVYNPSIKELAKNSFIEQSKNFPGSHPKTLNLSTKIGTPFYTAPECMTDSNYDYKADVYSLGVILFEMFSKFTTMHERHVIFTQFKKDHRVNPQFREKHPVVADLVEYLCQGEPGNRPYASEVKMSRQYSDWMKEVEGAYGGP